MLRASPAVAANGETVTVGNSFTGTAVTKITNSAAYQTAFWGASASGVGVRGESTDFHGVQGSGRWGVTGTGTTWGVTGSSDTGWGVAGSSNSGTGVLGSSATGIGVAAWSTASDKPALSSYSGGDNTAIAGVSGAYVLPNRAKTGVYGEAMQDAGSRGVWGKSKAGRGVLGETSSGVGVFGVAANASGYAFRGSGRVRFDKVSGVATIAAGTKATTIKPGVDVSTDTFVLLTPRANLGGRDLWFTVDPAANTFTIRVNSNVPGARAIAWLMLR